MPPVYGHLPENSIAPFCPAPFRLPQTFQSLLFLTLLVNRAFWTRSLQTSPSEKHFIPKGLFDSTYCNTPQAMPQECILLDGFTPTGYTGKKEEWANVTTVEDRSSCRFIRLNLPAVCEHLGREEGENLMERATFRYGFRRGRRMAKNAETHNGSKDLAGYFLYGELNSRPGENSSSLEFQHDSTLSAVERCAWADAWKQYGLWEYGRIYCRQVDAGLCTGYGGGFYLTVEETMGAGDDRCLFRWSEGLTPEEQTSLEQKKAVLGNSVQKSYAFHCKELLMVVSEVLGCRRSS